MHIRESILALWKMNWRGPKDGQETSKGDYCRKPVLGAWTES